MRVCFGVIVRVRINHRCVCVASVVFVRFAPSDPGVRVVTLAWQSAFCAGFSDGVISRWLRGKDPLRPHCHTIVECHDVDPACLSRPPGRGMAMGKGVVLFKSSPRTARKETDRRRGRHRIQHHLPTRQRAQNRRQQHVCFCLF